MKRPTKTDEGLVPDRTGEFLLYRSEDGSTRIECRFDHETVWLTQALMADLFQTSIPNVNMHLKAIYGEGELTEPATVKDYLTVRTEGKRSVNRLVKYYNLDAILAVGYRIRSPRGTQFRQWATARLSEYLLKGFTMDDARLKQAGGGNYFDELLARIRDIRSSEKVFWRKVLDIYATSIDYDPRAEASEAFFKTVQNKMHWAAHGHTAAEVISVRADAGKPNMGLTSWAGARPRKTDVAVAKNYLDAAELDALNRIVTAYLEFAELQAIRRRSMTMRDWIAKLDDFLTISDHDILTHAGKVSHEMAVLKAETEFGKYTQQVLAEPTQAEKDFDEATRRIADLPAPRQRTEEPEGENR